MNEKRQYKEAIRTFNQEMKELKGKLEEADRQKQKLQEEVKALHEKMETARTNTVQKFKTQQLFIDSCADYYGTGFDNCLKHVTSAFPELDLSEITMDAPEPMMPVGNVVTNDDDGTPKSQLPPKDDGGVVLAQPTVNAPPAPVSKILVLAIGADDPQPQKDGGNLADAPNA